MEGRSRGRRGRGERGLEIRVIKHHRRHHRHHHRHRRRHHCGTCGVQSQLVALVFEGQGPDGARGALTRGGVVIRSSGYEREEW